MPGKGKGKDKGKGKARQQQRSDDGEIATLDVLTFLKEQIETLDQPLKLLGRDEYIFEDQEGTEVEPPAQKTLDKAVKALKSVLTASAGERLTEAGADAAPLASSELVDRRKKRFNEASLQAVVEQVDYLKEEHLAGLHTLQVNSDEGTVRVDM